MRANGRDELTTAEAAAYASRLGYPLTPNALVHAINAKRLTARRPGRDWLITRAEIERYVRERRTRRRPGPRPTPPPT